MEIILHCDNCGCRLVADDETESCVVECSKCHQFLPIPHRASGASRHCQHCGAANPPQARACTVCRRDLESGQLVITSTRRGKSVAKKNTGPRLSALHLEEELTPLHPPHSADAAPGPRANRRAFTVLCLIVTGFVLGFAGIAFWDELTEGGWFGRGSLFGDVKHSLCSVLRGGD